jgi:PAS domain S-box-containing protein
MKEAGTESRQLKALRHRAEALLHEKPQALGNMPPEDIQQLIHELQVHQIELEMQNEELRRTQSQLAEARDKYLDLYDFAPVSYFALDKNALVTEANLTGANLLSMDRRLLINSSFTRLIAPDFQDGFYFHRRQVVETATKQTCELKLLKNDGTEFYGLLESIAVTDAEGNFKQFRTAITDITKRKRAEDALRENKSTIQALIDATPESALLIDTKNNVLAINEMAAQRLGNGSEGIVGRSPYDYLPPEVAQHRSKKLKQVLATGKQVHFSDEREGRHFYNSLYPVFNSKGDVEKVAIFAQDLSMQRQTELSLRESAEKYRQLFENDSDAVMIFDAETRQFEDANKATLDLYGYSKDEFFTLKVEDISVEKEKTKSNVKKIRDGGVFPKRVLLLYFKKKDDTVFPGEISAGRFIIGGRQKICAAVRDITERMNAQEDLRKSEARYRALSEATFEAIFISEKGICVDTNQRATELLGYDYDELIGIFGTDVIASESKELVEQNMLSGYEKPYEAIAQKKDGSQFHVEIRGKMMRYKERDARITVIRDINEQKRAAEALHKSEKRYRDLFNSIPIGLYRTTPEGSILDVNPAMLDILGYPDRARLLQVKSLETYVDPDDRKRFQHLLEEQGFVHDFTVRLRRYDGRSIWVTINTTIVHHTDSKMTYFEGAMADISSRIETEELIHKLSQQLMQAQEGERKMISRELHDTVAQDLSVAKMECDLIYAEQLNKRLPEAQRIKEISEALQKTILGVRNMAYDLRPPVLEELGLVETIYRLCEDFAQMWGLPVDFQSAGLKNLKLDYDIQINLYRLVQEGLSNIRKHAAASRVTLKLAAAFPNIILRIEDNGRGFDVQKREAVAGQEKRMGLRSMQERATLLNGEMKLQSKPGQGTKVSIKLPFAEKMSGTKENHLNR